jgi:hypothetical protein
MAEENTDIDLSFDALEKQVLAGRTDLSGTQPTPTVDQGPALSPQEQTAAQVNASLLDMIRRGEDPREQFPTTKGWLGQKDVFGPEIEKGFSPRVREFVRNYYGPAEIQYDPDGSAIGNLWRRVFGSAPTEEERAQIRTAQQLSAGRGGRSASSKYKRTIGELTSGAPDPSEIRGEIPEDVDLPPWLQEVASEPRKVEMPRFQAEVILRDYGIRQGTDQDQEVIGRARDSAKWLTQLESIEPGLASNTIGPILAADFNAHYGLTDTDQEVTSEGLDIRQIDWQGTPRLVYTHPETGKPTLFDPLKLELRDIAEVLPELTVIGGDIIGMIGGTIAGAATGTPVGTPIGGGAVGNILGGAAGAYFGRLWSQKIALGKNNFVYDPRYGGWTKDGFVGRDGNPKVITEWSLMKNALPDAAWSAGGNVFLRALFKGGKLLLFGRDQGLRGGLSADEFVEAIDKFRGTRLGLATETQEIPVNTSVALQKRGEDLLDQAANTTGVDARNLHIQGQKLLQQAEVLRAAETGTEAAGQREVLSTALETEAMTTVGVTAGKVAEATAGDVAGAVTKGLPVVAQKEVGDQLVDLATRNNALVKEFDELVAGGTAQSADELGEALANKATVIMGASDGSTGGIYGVYKTVGDALRKPAFTSGVPQKPFEISGVTKLVDKLQTGTGPGQGSPVLGGAFAQGFLDKWNLMLHRVGTKAGEARGTVDLDYPSIRQLIISARAELGGQMSQPQRANMSAVVEELERIQIAGLKTIDDANRAAGSPTNYARAVESADSHMQQLAEIWLRGKTQGLKEGSYGTIADKLFAKDATPGFVGEIFRTLKPGKNDLDLMRNTLLYMYKRNMRNLARGETGVSEQILGREVSVGLGKDTASVIPAAEGAHGAFTRDHESWINSLFKPAEWDQLTRAVTTGARQQKELKQLAQFNETLQKNPLFGGALVKINQDLSKVVVRDAQLLMDVAFNLPPGQRQQGFEALFKALKGLPKEDRFIARENIKALAMRRLFDPDSLIAGTKEAQGTAINRGSSRAAYELKANEAVYNTIFGKSHAKDLGIIFKDLATVAQETTAAGLASRYKSLDPSIGLSLLQWKMGVLNARARALTKAGKLLSAKFQRKFNEALMDPERAARLVRMRNTNIKTKFGLNALGQILGIETGEILRGMEEFSFPETTLEDEALRLN